MSYPKHHIGRVLICLRSTAIITLSETATTTLPVSSSAETSILDTTLTTQATETSEVKAETETPTTLETSATSVDITTVDGETSTILLDTTEATTTTAAEVTTTAAETTTTEAAGCPQVTVLANPTPIFSASDGNLYDDEYGTVGVPFEVGVFGSSSSTVYVSVNGLLTLGQAPGLAFVNSNLPAQDIPEISIMPYWDDFYITGGLCGIGISYEVYETRRGRTFTVEYYVSVNDHFTVSMYEDHPGLVRYAYYKTSRHGEGATVGVQNGMLKSQYSYNTPDSISDNFYVEIDTSSGEGVITSGQL
ncbi:hypothetical protein FPOAC2_00262 [Fusarium poae]